MRYWDLSLLHNYFLCPYAAKYVVFRNYWKMSTWCRFYKLLHNFSHEYVLFASYNLVGISIVSAMASQITRFSIFCSAVCSGADQRTHQSSASLPLRGESTGHRWIPCTKGQSSGKCFHLMTASYCSWAGLTLEEIHIFNICQQHRAMGTRQLITTLPVNQLTPKHSWTIYFLEMEYEYV